MLIHSGSGYHAHEYSRDAARTRLRSNSIPKRSPLARSAFSAPLLPIQTSEINENYSQVLRQPLRQFSENITSTKETVVRFQEIEEDTMSEDAKSTANSEGSITTAGGRRRRTRTRSVRTNTTFRLAHPPPTLTQKQKLLQIRPKLLLQLQQLSINSRPKPALDVLPSTNVVPRLYKRFPRMFRGKDKLGCHDVMIVKSEDYETDVEQNMNGSESDEDGLAKRDLVAVICQMPKDSGGSEGKAEMVLSDGSVWIASPLPNNRFEFVSTNEHGTQTTARWFRRSVRRQTVDTQDVLVNGETEFAFSIIDPSTRRHPVLATLNRNQLDIPNSYTTISPPASRQPPTSSTKTSLDDADSGVEDGTVPERTTIPIDQALRTLIQVTGVWLTLRNGWSPYFDYNDTKSVAKSTGRARSVSLTPEPGRLSPTPTSASTPESSHTLGAVLGGIRRVSAIGCPNNSNSPQSDRSTTPKRSVSTGTAFMQRAAARRATNAPSTVPSDSEGESMMEIKHNLIGFGTSSSPVATTPTSFGLPASSATPPDTPTRLPKRPQSYIPTSSLQNSFTNPPQSLPQRHSIANFNNAQSPEQTAKPKTGRWKSFTNFFRRNNRGPRSG
ncbi:hypothetical protein VTL71DRAFT_778 [Oculimacula yallundae]|uniref:Uncharacterized protein n=1 Tax=Oculimacula yallundae TaxID=86028 RepID=A0ABR4D0Z9_9HELO